MSRCTCEPAPIAFAVPTEFRESAPERAATAAICPTCLALTPAPDADASGGPTFDRLHEAFPGGRTGVAMALALGLIADSVATNRSAIAKLFEAVSDGGADPWLVLERVAATPTAARAVDLRRAHTQLEQLLE